MLTVKEKNQILKSLKHDLIFCFIHESCTDQIKKITDQIALVKKMKTERKK